MSDIVFAELAKPHRRVFYNRKWLRLEALDVDFILPTNVHTLAIRRRSVYPIGILVLHIDLRACILFRADRPPVLISLRVALELLRSRLTLGLAIASGSVYIIQYGKYKNYKTSLASVL